MTTTHLRWCTGLLVIAALGQPVSADGDRSEGESLEDRRVLGALSYRIHCLNCHGSSGAGDGPMAELLKIVPADLTRLVEGQGGEFPAERVYRVIDGRQDIEGHGSRQMPVWGISFQDLGRDADQEEAVRNKIFDIVAYLETLQVEDGPEPED